MMLVGLLLSVGLLAAVSGGFGDDDGGVASAVEVNEGTEDDDTMFGRGDTDLIDGRGGDDDITGLGDDDILLGGDGDDILKGREGDDFLVGGDGDDTLRGGDGDDTLLASDGADNLVGGGGNDLLIGAETLNRVPTASDILALLNGQPVADFTYEPPEDQEPGSYLNGKGGDDYLLIGEGDTAEGGQGNDTFELGEWINDADRAPVIEDYTPADDVIVVRYAAGNPPPTITVDTSDEGFGLIDNIYANGELIARNMSNEGGAFPRLSASDIQLVEVG